VTPVRVGVNLTWMVPGVVGGSEDSTTAALRAIAAEGPGDVALELLGVPALAQAHPDLVEAFPTRLMPSAIRGRPARIVAESTWLAAATRGLDLVHHAGGTAPPVRTAPHLITVHDLQPLEHDATHGRLKRAYLARALPPSVRTARLVVVPSEHVRRSLVDRLGTDPDRIVVVPHTGGLRPDPTPEADLRRRYGLDGPVVLYPSITYPHKNHVVLVRALPRLLAERPDVVLVLTGGEGSAEPGLAAEIDRLGVRDRVRRTGRVPLADVMGLVEVAEVVAVPSTYEGFGVPVAEAMTRGTPVVAARSTALPEVVGDAGLLVDPDDPDAWAGALAHLLGSPEERERLGAAGRARAVRWAPAAVAAALLDAYRRAARG
jgi:glycosyltransferase involved in cell wall biosynthesis